MVARWALAFLVACHAAPTPAPAPAPAPAPTAVQAAETQPLHAMTVDGLRYEVWATALVVPSKFEFRTDRRAFGIRVRVRVSSVDGAAHSLLGGPLSIGELVLADRVGGERRSGEGIGDDAPVSSTIVPGSPATIVRDCPRQDDTLFDVGEGGDTVQLFVSVKTLEPRRHVEVALITMTVPLVGDPEIRASEK